MSRVTKVDNLVVGKRYFVDVWWNIYNTVRDCEPYQFIGEFKKINYIPIKRQTNTHGLVTVITPARTEVVFHAFDQYGVKQNRDIRVSSMNHFYASYRPKSIELCHKRAIMKLNLPFDVKQYVTCFMETREKNTQKLLQIEKRNENNIKSTHNPNDKRKRNRQKIRTNNTKNA